MRGALRVTLLWDVYKGKGHVLCLCVGVVLLRTSAAQRGRERVCRGVFSLGARSG